MTPRTSVAPPCRILFVDDDPFYRDLAAATLQMAGMAHAVADNGAEVTARLARASYDVLVVDLSMPGRSGFEVLDELRGNERFADLPVIVITGDGDEATVARAFEGGATSFMVKPLNWPLFVQHIRYVHESARVRADLRHAQRTAEFMNELKSQMIGTLVTEFQGPLRSAFNFSRLITQEADGPLGSPLYTEWMGELHRSLERLSALHVKMLNFGRSLSEQIELNEHVVDIGQLVSSAVDQHQVAARRRNIVLTFDDALSAPQATRVDPVLLSNAIGGIVDNAVKFSRRGAEVVVRLGMSRQSQLAITVDDGVPSMSQSQIDQILDTKPMLASRPEMVQSCTALKMSRILIDAHQGQMKMRASARGMTTAVVLPRTRLVGDLHDTLADTLPTVTPAVDFERLPLKRSA